MKKSISLIVLSAGFIFGAAAVNAFAQNSIDGLVFDKNRRPVVNIEVELLDEYERFLRSAKTSTSGIYIFQGLRAGVYYVQVRVAGTNYKPAKERIQLGQTNFTNSMGRTSGSESLQVNLTLEVDSRRIGNQDPLNNEVIFAQDIPDEAKKSYENALKNFEEKKSDEAIAQLQNAIAVFPDYFLALERLGYEYLEQNKLAEAENVFKRATEINPKSFSSKYGLGIVQHKLGKKDEAIKTLNEAVLINPASINSFFWLGRIYREQKEFDKAETALKKAKELSENKLPEIHWELALLYYHNLQRYNEAANELELYLKANPKAENKEQVIKLIKMFREKAKSKV